MYYIYILYSESVDKFYIGYSDSPWRRASEHNTKALNTFTSKYRPWDLKAVFQISSVQGEAIRIERFIKQQKSRKLLKLLCDPSFIPDGFLSQLVRVPDIRD